jgi:hypothetical protein
LVLVSGKLVQILVLDELFVMNVELNSELSNLPVMDIKFAPTFTVYEVHDDKGGDGMNVNILPSALRAVVPPIKIRLGFESTI